MLETNIGASSAGSATDAAAFETVFGTENFIIMSLPPCTNAFALWFGYILSSTALTGIEPVLLKHSHLDPRAKVFEITVEASACYPLPLQTVSFCKVTPVHVHSGRHGSTRVIGPERGEHLPKTAIEKRYQTFR